jgi:Ca2+-binding RTX toxin-like protein
MVVTLAWGLNATAARATESCGYDAQTQVVRIVFGAPDTASVTIDSTGNIRVSGQKCGDATTTNTTAVRITGSAGNDTADLKLSGGDFPGIKLHIDLGGGHDRLRIFGGHGHDHIVIGSNGINLDADNLLIPDVLLAHTESVLINGDSWPDVISGNGGDGTGRPTKIPLRLYGGGGNDTAIGGIGNDVIEGNDNNDRLYGKTGSDIILGNKGDDYIDGGPGLDHCHRGLGTNQLVNCP